MTPTEATTLCRLVKACCPQQQIDEYTADAWGDLLSDLRLIDCQEAVKRLTRRQPFVAPSEIRDEVSRIRNDRIASGPYLLPPHELDDDPAAQIAWLKDARRRVANGEDISERVEIRQRRMPAFDRVFRTIPEEIPDDAA